MCLAVCLGISFPHIAEAQAPSQKDVNQQVQFWWSWNSTLRFTDTFGAVADFHIRRNDFVQDPSFYFVRFGGNYWINDQMTLTLGYAHMWQAPPQEDWTAWSDENRIYQQLQYRSQRGRVSVLSRLRNEQRWQEKIEQDVATGGTKFTNRIRYLLSLAIPVTENAAVPVLVLSDEILVQMGSEVVYNPFDQNRFFVGIRQSLTGDLNFDFGYMLVYQQKASGYQYDMNHTVRWFFYYAPDFRKNREKTPAQHMAGEE